MFFRQNSPATRDTIVGTRIRDERRAAGGNSRDNRCSFARHVASWSTNTRQSAPPKTSEFRLRSETQIARHFRLERANLQMATSSMIVIEIGCLNSLGAERGLGFYCFVDCCRLLRNEISQYGFKFTLRLYFSYEMKSRKFSRGYVWCGRKIREISFLFYIKFM